MAKSRDSKSGVDLGSFGLLFGLAGGAALLLALAWMLGWI